MTKKFSNLRFGRKKSFKQKGQSSTSKKGSTLKVGGGGTKGR